MDTEIPLSTHTPSSLPVFDLSSFLSSPVELVDCAQGSEEWLESRRGYVTSTGADAICAMKDLGTKGGRDNEATRLKYLRNLAYARVATSYDPAGFNATGPMERGTGLEPEACAYYSMDRNVTIEEVGFVRRGVWVGDSPDRIVRDEAGGIVGTVEVKCALMDAHAEYRELAREGRVPNTYVRQILHHLLVTGARWCDFVSYHPNGAGRLKMAVVRCERTVYQPLLDIYASKLVDFVNELAAYEARLREEM